MLSNNRFNIYVCADARVCVTIFSAGSKFQPLSNLNIFLPLIFKYPYIATLDILYGTKLKY